jgi:hypothetical protein
MANPEILQMRGRLATAKELAGSLKRGIEIDRQALRTILDPFEQPENIEVGQMEIIAKRLMAEVRRYRETQETIARLGEALGVEA